MRELVDILTRYEGAVYAVEADGDDTALIELEEARKELLEVLQLARRWEETNNLLQQNLLSTGTGFSPPLCSKHLTQMVLSFYDRPGGPQGNGWSCPKCAEENGSHPDATGYSL